MHVEPFLPRAAGWDRLEPDRRGPDAGFGPLEPLVADPEVTDVFVNGRTVWADRGRGAEREAGVLLDEDEARSIAVSLIGSAGRHLDEASPCVDARLGDGIRVHAVLPPISTIGPVLSIRLPAPRPLSLDDLDAAGCFPGGARPLLERLVAERANVLITGAAGTGKTTLLSAMLALADPSDRIVVIEDVAEARIAHPHVVSLETRQPNLEGAGGIDLARLVREALRMRPDRLVLGECRGAEIRELLAALNTGHDGGIGTLHANSLPDVPARLEALAALAGLGPEALARQAVSAIGAVVHLERDPGGRRTVAAIGRLGLDARDRLAITELAMPAPEAPPGRAQRRPLGDVEADARETLERTVPRRKAGR